MQNQPSSQCPVCGADLPESTPQGLCPKCLLAAAVEPRPRLFATTPGASSPAPTLDEIAACFPQWEIIDLIGQGGMGAVYKVRQPALDRLVALKILPAELERVPGFSERFAREARLLAKLAHPNIVSVHDYGQAGPYCYLVMEYVDGVNLREAMQAGRFSAKQALDVVRSVCDALEYAHDQGVVHRDIKPENILMDTRGKVKLADFGIGKLATAEPQLTITGASLGTPQYMAPEQIENPQDVDHRADIYSLGVVFYELLTGELPLGRFATPSERVPLDPRVDPVVMKALEKQRERRHQDASQMRTAAENAGTGPVPKIAPPKAGGPHSTLHRKAVGLLITSVLLCAVILAMAKNEQFTSMRLNDQENAIHLREFNANQRLREAGIEQEQIDGKLEAILGPPEEQKRSLLDRSHDLHAEISDLKHELDVVRIELGIAAEERSKLSSPPPVWFVLVAVLGICTLLSCGLGWSSLFALHRSGQEEGRIAAMFTAWLLPLLALGGGIGALITGLLDHTAWKNLHAVHSAGQGLAVLIWVVASVWLLRISWNWLKRETPPPARRFPAPLAVATGIALILVAIILFNLPA